MLTWSSTWLPHLICELMLIGNVRWIPDLQPELFPEAMMANFSRMLLVEDTRKLEPEHLGLLVDWLGTPENFEKLMGSGSCRDIAIQHPSKKITYDIMLVCGIAEKGFSKVCSQCGKPWQEIWSI